MTVTRVTATGDVDTDYAPPSIPRPPRPTSGTQAVADLAVWPGGDVALAFTTEVVLGPRTAPLPVDWRGPAVPPAAWSSTPRSGSSSPPPPIPPRRASRCDANSPAASRRTRPRHRGADHRDRRGIGPAGRPRRRRRAPAGGPRLGRPPSHRRRRRRPVLRRWRHRHPSRSRLGRDGAGGRRRPGRRGGRRRSGCRHRRRTGRRRPTRSALGGSGRLRVGGPRHRTRHRLLRLPLHECPGARRRTRGRSPGGRGADHRHRPRPRTDPHGRTASHRGRRTARPQFRRRRRGRAPRPAESTTSNSPRSIRLPAAHW